MSVPQVALERERSDGGGFIRAEAEWRKMMAPPCLPGVGFPDMDPRFCTFPPAASNGHRCNCFGRLSRRLPSLSKTLCVGMADHYRSESIEISGSTELRLLTCNRRRRSWKRGGLRVQPEESWPAANQERGRETAKTGRDDWTRIKVKIIFDISNNR